VPYGKDYRVLHPGKFSEEGYEMDAARKSRQALVIRDATEEISLTRGDPLVWGRHSCPPRFPGSWPRFARVFFAR